MHRPTIFLFDVDGTLLSTGAGRRAIERAFDRLHARPDATGSFRFDGMTDRAICRRGLEAIGAGSTEAAIDALLAVYVTALVEEVATAADYRVHAGAVRCVEAAARRPRSALGLGTGNVREAARAKLSRASLERHFSFGGFGCDAEDRVELLRTGARRGAERLGVALEACRVVVIGDTPRDVAAAQGIGAECVGVGTGSFRAEELRAAGATAAFDELDAPEAIAAVLGDG